MEGTPFLSCLLGRPNGERGLRAPWGCRHPCAAQPSCCVKLNRTRLHFFFLLLLIQARSGWRRADGSYNEVPENEKKKIIFFFLR